MYWASIVRTATGASALRPRASDPKWSLIIPTYTGPPPRPMRFKVKSRIADEAARITAAYDYNTALRDQIKRTTPMVTQAQLGITKPWTRNWQTAASVQLTNTGASALNVGGAWFSKVVTFMVSGQITF